MKKTLSKERKYLDVYYFTADQSIGEKLVRSRAHAERKRRQLEEKCGKAVNMVVLKEIVKKGSRIVKGW